MTDQAGLLPKTTDGIYELLSRAVRLDVAYSEGDREEPSPEQIVRRLRNAAEPEECVVFDLGVASLLRERLNSVAEGVTPPEEDVRVLGLIVSLLDELQFPEAISSELLSLAKRVVMLPVQSSTPEPPESHRYALEAFVQLKGVGRWRWWRAIADRHGAPATSLALSSLAHAGGKEIALFLASSTATSEMARALTATLPTMARVCGSWDGLQAALMGTLRSSSRDPAMIQVVIDAFKVWGRAAPTTQAGGEIDPLLRARVDRDVEHLQGQLQRRRLVRA